jgi:hypothetical protein
MAWQLGGYLRAQLLFQLDPSTPARPSRVACLFVIDRPRGCALMPHLVRFAGFATGGSVHPLDDRPLLLCDPAWS